MKIWLASFLILLALVQFYQWLRVLTIPLPFLLLGGAILAIVSNTVPLQIFSQKSQDLTPDNPQPPQPKDPS